MPDHVGRYFCFFWFCWFPVVFPRPPFRCRLGSVSVSVQSVPLCLSLQLPFSPSSCSSLLSLSLRRSAEKTGGGRGGKTRGARQGGRTREDGEPSSSVCLLPCPPLTTPSNQIRMHTRAQTEPTSKRNPTDTETATSETRQGTKKNKKPKRSTHMAW